MRECNLHRSGIDIRLGQFCMRKYERDVEDCSPVNKTSSPHDIDKFRSKDPKSCILGKGLKFGQLSTLNFSREGWVSSAFGKSLNFPHSIL